MQKDLDASKEQDISALSKSDSKTEVEIGVKCETESVVTEVEVTQKSIDIPPNETKEEVEKYEVSPKDSGTEKSPNAPSSSQIDETNMEDLRKACNETPTYEAWRTGQVPSPLKRGKSCKTPSPPPCPEKITKASSVPTTSRISSGSRKSSNGKKKIFECQNLSSSDFNKT